MMPETGYLRLHQIIGQRAVTQEEATINKEFAKISNGSGVKRKTGRPCSPRQFIPAIVPWSKSKLWDAVKKNEFPTPVKLSSRTTAWTVESIREFCTRKAM